MIGLETQEAGTGKWFPIMLFVPGTPEQRDRADDLAETLTKMVGLYTRVTSCENPPDVEPNEVEVADNRGALSDEQIADLWDFDLTQHWVRVKLASRLRDAGLIVVPAAALGGKPTPKPCPWSRSLEHPFSGTTGCTKEAGHAGSHVDYLGDEYGNSAAPGGGE